MTSTDQPAARARRFGRKDDGPRASVRELLPYLAVRRGLLIGAIVLSIIGAATALAQPLLVQQAIGRVQESVALGWLPWLLIVLVIANAVISGGQHFLLQILGERVVQRSRHALVARILHLPIATFDVRRTGDLVSRVSSDTTLLRAVLTQGLVESVGGLLTFAGAVVAMLVIDWRMFLLTFAVVVGAIGLAVTLMPHLRRASAKAQEQVGALAAALERAITGVRTIRAGNATEREIALLGARADAAYAAGVGVARASAAVVPIAGVALQVAILVVLGIGGARVAGGDLGIADLVAFLMFLFLLTMPLAQIVGAMAAVSQALGALGRIQEIVRLPVESDGDVLTSAPSIADGGAVTFEGVGFGYPSAPEQPVLTDVSFAVPAGSRTALVGPSGAGKSTIFALIERFYDASHGQIRVGGADITGLTRSQLRRGIGYVEQDAPVLAGTIAENLRLVAPQASDDQLHAVLAQVNLSEVIDRNPAGLDAEVGEHGVRLSGGERQRLAIARALLTAPPLLLLDESTSSLDSRNEAQLRAAVDEVASGRTLLVIAHRLATVIDSDQIIVLDHGRVAATGTHTELLQTSPLYRELARHQLLAPADEATR